MGPLLAIASTTQRGREPGRLHTAPSPVTILVPIPLTPFPLSVPLYRSWCQSLPTPSTSCVTFIVSSFSGLPPWPSHSLPLATSSSRPRASPSLPPSLLTPPSPRLSPRHAGGGRKGGKEGGREGGKRTKARTRHRAYGADDRTARCRGISQAFTTIQVFKILHAPSSLSTPSGYMWSLSVSLSTPCLGPIYINRCLST